MESLLQTKSAQKHFNEASESLFIAGVVGTGEGQESTFNFLLSGQKEFHLNLER